MYNVFYGNDKIKARSQAQKMVAAAKKKHTNAAFFKLNTDNFSENKLDELISNQGLFYSGSIVFCDNLCEEEENSNILLKKVKEIKESPNFFIFLEGKINKKELEKLEKNGEKIEEFILPLRKLTEKEELAQKGEKISFFKFTDAFGAKDKKELWTLYQDALSEGVPAEEVHGILFWQLKSMLSAVRSGDASEAGLNPYVYTKAKSYAKNFGDKKLKEISSQFFQMYHEAHRGKIDFPIALERFILSL